MKCQCCRKDKSEKEFSRHRGRKSGYQGYCKICAKLSQARWRLKDPKRAIKGWRKRHVAYYATIKGRATYMLIKARQSAKHRGITFGLTHAWISKQLRSNRCSVTGIPFSWERILKNGYFENGFSPSLDRINPKGGYVPRNCRLVIWMYNRARGGFPDEEFNRMIRACVNKEI